MRYVNELKNAIEDLIFEVQRLDITTENHGDALTHAKETASNLSRLLQDKNMERGIRYDYYVEEKRIMGRDILDWVLSNLEVDLGVEPYEDTKEMADLAYAVVDAYEDATSYDSGGIEQDVVMGQLFRHNYLTKEQYDHYEKTGQIKEDK